VNSLHDKAFVLSYAKILGKNVLIINTYIPNLEFPVFLNILGLLTEMGYIIDFSYLTLTLVPHKRGGVPYEMFENGKWHFDLKSNFAKLRAMKT
jgi:hypothetical protein